MRHRIEEHELSADYPIAYSIGAGKVGRSYLIELGGHLFQSPAAYYTAHGEWNASPGYERSQVLDFSRAITSDCLACHTGAVKQRDGKVELTAITCERCHGPTEHHLRNPVPGSIANPAKLHVRERDSVCEQCHLEGASVVLNPGKDWWDFHAGEVLEKVETHYVYRNVKDQPTSIAAVSQAEQLSLSACLRGSAGKLWCGTCHDPHGVPAVSRKAEMRQICQSCHSAAQLASTHQPEQQDCVSCHMPSRKAVDVAHAAVTDHRISKRPGSVMEETPGRSMVAWHDALPEYAERDLGLAFFNTARREQSIEDFQQSFTLLSKLPAAQEDGAVSAAKGYMLLGSGHTQAALECFQRAVKASPESGEYLLDLGVAENAAGDREAAIGSFRSSIGKIPYDYRPYQALAQLYTRVGKADNARLVVGEFLRLVPESLTMRLPEPFQKP